MLKVKPPDDYPPEEGRYVRGNDFSPVAVCVILDCDADKIPSELEQLVMAGVDSGAALSGTLQTENIGLEKMICNIVANPNIRYIALCGRESCGRESMGPLPGEALHLLKENGIDEKKRIIGARSRTPYLFNLPLEVIERFNKQIVTIVNLLCKPGEGDLDTPGLNPEVIKKAVWSCYQEEPTDFMSYSLYDIGAYAEPPISHKLVWRVSEPWRAMGRAKKPEVSPLVVSKLLPGTNCKECNEITCLAFAFSLLNGDHKLEDCPYLNQPEFTGHRQALAKLLDIATED